MGAFDEMSYFRIVATPLNRQKESPDGLSSTAKNPLFSRDRKWEKCVHLYLGVENSTIIELCGLKLLGSCSGSVAQSNHFLNQRVAVQIQSFANFVNLVSTVLKIKIYCNCYVLLNLQLIAKIKELGAGALVQQLWVMTHF